MIPDLQVKPGVRLDHLEWCGHYIAEKEPDVVVQIGDFADMESLSSYDQGKKSAEGRRVEADIQATRVALGLLQKGMGSFTPKRKVLTLGNHENRITRAIEDDPKWEGRISIDHLGYKEFGWEVVPFLQPINIDGVTYCHYFPSGPKGYAIGSAAKLLSTYHVTCIAGHQQGRLAAGPILTGDGRFIHAIIAGSFYQHKEGYLPGIQKQHWCGIVVLNEVRDGMFDEMYVSLDFLRRKYGSKSHVVDRRKARLARRHRGRKVAKARPRRRSA